MRLLLLLVVLAVFAGAVQAGETLWTGRDPGQFPDVVGDYSLAPAPAGAVDWDRERAAIDTIVIHHSAADNVSRAQLSKDGLERSYAPLFKGGNKDPEIKPGTLPYSDHFWRTKGGVVETTFVLYHWYVRQDGTREHLLPDAAVGWHAGNWRVNCRSVGICIDGDYSKKPPSTIVLVAVARIVADLCQRYKIRWLVGHRDVRIGGTTCPGDWFCTGGREQIVALADWMLGKNLGISFDSPDAVSQTKK